MNLLAINCNHDGAGVILSEGRISGYVNTERYSRKKKHPGIREADLQGLLDQANLRIDEIDLVQFVNLNTMDSPDIPYLYGTNLKETWPDIWFDLTFKRVRILDRIVPCAISNGHHLFHAAVAYYFSPFDSAVSFACDPVGAGAYFFTNGKRIPAPPRRTMTAPDVYMRVSEKLFGCGLIGAGKLMALAPFGSESNAKISYAELSERNAEDAYQSLIRLTADEETLVHDQGASFNAALAYHAQCFLEFEISAVLDELYRTCTHLGVEPNLCLSGGTALNSVANQKCFERSLFESLYLHPACGDDGTAIGAALIHWHHTLQQPKLARSNRDAMYSCRTYEAEIPCTLRRYADRITVCETRNYVEDAARMISRGSVIGWFQGASEIGPRALGNRSILADPRRAEIKAYLNNVIKSREAFRPFAPSVLAEHAQPSFGLSNSPFMLRVAPVLRKDVPAISHVDGTARVQTVSKTDNPLYYDLINTFFQLTDIPLLLNTSFNGKGEPIVETPEDAIECMLRTKLDAVVFPGMIVRAA